MKHFITGVAGFVGSNLARKLIENGDEVWGIHNLACGFKNNLEDIIDNKKFNFSQIDILDDLLVNWPVGLKRSKFQGFIPSWGPEVDYVWHLAARGETYWCRDNVKSAVSINVEGTLNMLKMAQRCKCKHFFFADTSAEYDSFEDEQYYPSAEWMAPNTITPMGYYAITKMAASQFVRSFGLSNGIGTTLFRYTNIYGPSMNLNRDIPPVVGSFTNRIFNGEDCIIYGDGSKRRDFLHIEDLNDFHIAALEHRQDKKDSQTFNAGSGENHSIHGVWKTVYHICKEYFPTASYKIHYLADQPNEAQITLANIDKAKEHLNWEPKISFAEGVKKTVQSLWEMRNDS